MSKTYFIKLKPTKPFFFGGESGFGFGTEANYLVKSRYFPQQTSLLGMLRFQLLKQNNLLTKQDGKSKVSSVAEMVIGKESFITNNENQSFGAIEKLSPILVYNGNEALFSTPFTYNLSLEKDDTAKAFINGEKSFSVRLKKADGDFLSPKDYLNTSLISKKDTYDITKDNSANAVFKPKQQVGITKDPTAADNKKGFYKKTSYQFNNKGLVKEGNEETLYTNSFCFGFHVEIDETNIDEFSKLDGTLVNLGGERSLFKMEITDVTDKGMPNFENETVFNDAFGKDKFTKIVLVSEAYVSPDIYDKCDFAVTQTIDFRNIESSVLETEQYYNLPKKRGNKKQLQRGIKKTLLARGSVFYCIDNEQVKAVKAMLNTAENFQKIGYNQYTIIKSLN